MKMAQPNRKGRVKNGAAFFFLAYIFWVMTDQQKLKPYKTFDIINPVFFVSGADFC
jgi:hypothetical protein